MKTVNRRSYGIGTWLDYGSRWLLAAVFMIAGIQKLFDPLAFAEVIGAYGLLPEGAISPVAVLLPLAEIVAAIALFAGRKEGLWSITVMMLCFIAVLIYGIRLGLDIDCGCFAPGNPEHEAFSGLRTALIRDLLLCVPLGYGWWYHNTFKLRCGEKKL